MDHYKKLTPEEAQRYKESRPEYPGKLFEILRASCHDRDLAWDCATGCGQAAAHLADWFRTVVATDASGPLLAVRKRCPNIGYANARAERAPLPDASVDLVTVAQALHWFDLPHFFAEARRVLKPCGLVAAWCYFLPGVDPRVDAAVSRLFHEVLGGHVPPQTELVRGRYDAISLPFEEVVRMELEMVERWDLHRLALYLRTWAGTGGYRSKTGPGTDRGGQGTNLSAAGAIRTSPGRYAG